MGIPLSLMAIMGGRDVWITGDRFIEYGYISDPLVAEAIERVTWTRKITEADNVSLQKGDSFRKSSKSGFHDSNLVQ